MNIRYSHSKLCPFPRFQRTTTDKESITHFKRSKKPKKEV
nr:MAG TPA: hypothetical protein [Caudoviricetes sp.]